MLSREVSHGRVFTRAHDLDGGLVVSQNVETRFAPRRPGKEVEHGDSFLFNPMVASHQLTIRTGVRDCRLLVG